MASQTVPYVTPEEYLEADREAEYKSEYLDGRVYAMSGGTRRHSVITINLVAEFRASLKGRQCEVHGSDMRLLVSEKSLYTYPDVSVVCGDPEFGGQEQDILLNPTLIVEVLSKSAGRYDRGVKFFDYQMIPSLRECLFVSPYARKVDQCTRRPDGDWLVKIIGEKIGRIVLSSIGIEIGFDQIYAGLN